MKLTPKERFLARVRPDAATGCWLWQGQIRPDGYGTTRLQGRHQLAHRAAWILLRGEIPPHLVLCHRCDVRACVNPGHLFLGTQAENVLDMKRKGRCRQGARNPRSRLDRNSVLRIKTLLRDDRLYMTEIARLFGISHSTVRDIKLEKRWCDVQLPPAETHELPAAGQARADRPDATGEDISHQ